MLDIGGGPGIYAAEFARKNPRLQITILDDDKTLEVAKRNTTAAGLDDRISFLPGDVFETAIEQTFDWIFVVQRYSQLQHRAEP